MSCLYSSNNKDFVCDMESIFKIFRDSVFSHGTVINAPVYDTDIVNKAYVDSLPYVITQPAGSANEQVAVYNGVTGNKLKAVPVTISTLGDVANINILTVNGTTNLNGGAAVPSNKSITLNQTIFANSDAVTKLYVDTKFALEQITSVDRGVVGSSTMNQLVRWEDTESGVIKGKGTFITLLSDTGTLIVDTINAVTSYQFETVDYLRYKGGTASAPDVLLVGPTGYSISALTHPSDNIFMGKNVTSGVTNLQVTASGNIFIGNDIITTPNNLTPNPQNNVAIGQGSVCYKLTDGARNVVIGYGAGLNLVDGENNVLIGPKAGEAISGGGGAGESNVCIGNEAGKDNVVGISNVFIGNAVGNGLAPGGIANTTGDMNVALGYHADTQNHDEVVVLGKNGVSAASNCFTISSVITRWNSSGLTLLPSGNTLLFDTATGNIGYMASSARYKTDILPLEAKFDSSRIFDLEPKSFVWKSTCELDYGLIAEEVVEVFPDLVAYNKDGIPETVKYNKLPVLLLNEVRKLREINRDLEERLAHQEALTAIIRQKLGI
jgi:hypothetical protein